ncbi:GPO family capsid scaffolding protein [Acerihabitans sp. TG2]|uniref:GPO family capsid scaffolding protein n=1 Tax=Acerihabitans sp. TG2 TaxID=3096008 RepID=UPI002B227FF4|nr:GPO family capsid scaffolding protein [Acerihabitans sp. TG2]MEA9389550.1 GPO family capsid scaffolding protein [Acerihabitans sp. TG2]
MAKKVSKFFRIGVEGDTCDGRMINADDIQQMAETFDTRVYGCRLNLEHLKGVLPDGAFRRYGDVLALKAEQIADDSVLNGKWALFAQISPTDDLVLLNQLRQKIYTSMEVQPNFANSGKAYLVGLAVTDDPASLGTEMLAFSASAQNNPLAARKTAPDNLFTAAVEVSLEFEDVTEPGLSLFTRVKTLLTGKQTTDDARLADVFKAVEAVAEHVQLTAAEQDTKLSTLETTLTERLAVLEQAMVTDHNQVTALTNKLTATDSQYQTRRPLATGGREAPDEVLTDC